MEDVCGFPQADSTKDAIRMVVNLAKDALSSGRCYAAFAWNVKNTFNSARIISIISLVGIGAPGYLGILVQNYLSKKTLLYRTDEGPKEYAVTVEVPQGSALSPLIRNVIYNGVLVRFVPEEATTVRCADEPAVVVTAKYPEE